ncbi:MAG: type I methionyl aminopeptidase [Clostridiales bacterium]|nr:type I methionyl aminopeptidase [Clostridiales bacterium]
MISIKSKTEIDAMKVSGRIVNTVLNEIGKAIRPGITTLELDNLATGIILKSGAIPSFKGQKGHKDAPDFPAGICASVNNEVVHGVPCLRHLKDGDIISIDVGAFCNGFHADAARTFPVGVISRNAARIIKVTEESFFEGIKNAVVYDGKRIYDISAAIQDHVEGHGYSIVRDYVGHGIGRDMWESPQIPNFRAKERGPKLMAGMALAVEPMVNEGRYEVKVLDNKWTVVTKDGSLSAHYENTIILTDGEPLIITI